jgi:uncharacterized protein YjiS (DUF1127 family)
MTVIGKLHIINVAPALAILSKYLHVVAGAISSWNDARMTRNALSQLSTRELEDIGLVHSDIDKISRR